jgi:outer membrane protein assembly factor BamB
MHSLPTASVGLGAVEPGGSRHLGRRSVVTVADETVVAGTADGAVVAFDADLDERWRARDREAGLVAATVLEDTVVVGERGVAGELRAYDLATGALRWRYETASDVGDPQRETRFFLPFVAALTTDGDRVYVAARRYERDGESRVFESLVAAFEPDGTEAWRYETDASPIALDVRDERVAVAYNRCTGDHQCGLVVLDAATGTERLTWDPGTEGQRRVGDVSLLADGLVVTSHGDHRCYRLDGHGGERWAVPLATPEPVDGETVYAYPNHVYATSAGVGVVTGNTYPVDGRETDARHPAEHTVFGLTPDGETRWRAPVDGFATGIGTDAGRVAVPAAQHFRDRDASDHGLGVFELQDGELATIETRGVVTTAAVDGPLVAAVEEPVAYHDEEQVRGDYRLHVHRLD